MLIIVLIIPKYNVYVVCSVLVLPHVASIDTNIEKIL